MHILILVLHVCAALTIVGLVLLQHGKGADAGAAFGSGASGSASVFGSAGSANFLSRSTAVLAVVFFTTSFSLTYFSTRPVDTSGVMTGTPPAQTLPGKIPGQTTGEGAESAPSAPPPAAPAPAGPAESGRVQDVPK